MLVIDYLLVYEMYKGLLREPVVEPLTHVSHSGSRSGGASLGQGTTL